jgi:hypothetical protein
MSQALDWYVHALYIDSVIRSLLASSFLRQIIRRIRYALSVSKNGKE